MPSTRTVQLTAAGHARLEAELTELREERQPGIQARIQELTEHADVTDNSEYEELKDEWQKLEARITDLEQTLQHAEILSPDADADRAGLGNTVVLRSDDGEEETWVLVNHAEANATAGTISTESPVGSAIFGRKAGESTTVATPSGEIVFTIVSIT